MAETEAKRTVLIIITLDTKGDEARFLKERIVEDGLDVLVLDSGISETPGEGLFRTSQPPRPHGPRGPAWRNSARKAPEALPWRRCSRERRL